MNLLICTQAIDIDNPILGFFHSWVEEFAKYCDEVHVICLEKGNHSLPNNVFVYSLGKEEGKNRLTYTLRFLVLIIRLNSRYDSVFVHMNQVYVLLGWSFWKLTRKQIGLWYMHKSVTLGLRVATKLVNWIFTGSAESFPILSKKVLATGHGINVNNFKPAALEKDIDFVAVSRISRIKNIDVLLELFEKINSQKESSLTIVGGCYSEDDRKYLSELKMKQHDLGLDSHVTFFGAITQKEMPDILSRSKVLLHPATYASLDKTILESLAVGTPVVSKVTDTKYIPGDVFAVSDKEFVNFGLKWLDEHPTDAERETMIEYVNSNHSIKNLIPKIIESLR